MMVTLILCLARNKANVIPTKPQPTITMLCFFRIDKTPYNLLKYNVNIFKLVNVYKI